MAYQSCCFCVSPRAVIAVPHLHLEKQGIQPTFRIFFFFFKSTSWMMHHRWSEWRSQSSAQWLTVSLCLLWSESSVNERNETRWLWCHSSAWLRRVSGISQSRLPEGLEGKEYLYHRMAKSCCSWWQVLKRKKTAQKTNKHSDTLKSLQIQSANKEGWFGRFFNQLELLSSLNAQNRKRCWQPWPQTARRLKLNRTLRLFLTVFSPWNCSVFRSWRLEL